MTRRGRMSISEEGEICKVAFLLDVFSNLVLSLLFHYASHCNWRHVFWPLIA